MSNLNFQFPISPASLGPSFQFRCCMSRTRAPHSPSRVPKFLVPSLVAKLKIGPPQILSQGKQIGPKLSHERVNWGAELTLDHLVMIQHLFLGTHLKTQVLR